MTLSVLSAAQRARDLLTHQPESVVGLSIPDLSAMVPTALEEFSRRLALSNDYRQWQKDFTVSPTAGLIDLTALSGILFNLHRCPVRIASSNVHLTPVRDLRLVESGALPVDQVYYTQIGTTLRFMNTDGSLVTFITSVKIASNFYAALSDITTTFYEGMYVRTLAELALGQMEKSSLKIKADLVEEAEAGRA